MAQTETKTIKIYTPPKGAATDSILLWRHSDSSIRQITFAVLDSALSNKQMIIYDTASQSLKYYDSTLKSWQAVAVPAMSEAHRDSILSPVVGQTIFNTDENCLNTYASDSTWKSICGGPQRAVFTLNSCGDIVNSGVYVQNTPLTAGNYLTMTVNVSKAGSYTISGSTINGYGFSTQGTFFGTGQQVITVPSQGTPVSASQSPGDTVTFLFNDAPETVCTGFTIPVVPNIATYSIDCNSIYLGDGTNPVQFVKGQTLKTTPFTSGSPAVTFAPNIINVRVTVTTTGFYNISVPATNGVEFGASGYFSSPGSQTVQLFPTPTSAPTVNNNFPVTITSNSTSGNTSCSVTIPMTLPPMTYGLIGNDGTYSAIAGGRAASYNGTSFGPNGIVKIVQLTNRWSTTDPATAANNINTNPPDIVLFYAYNTNSSPGLVQALANYVNNGGVLIYASNSTGNNNVDPSDNGNGLTITRQLLSGIYGNTYGQTAPQWQETNNVNGVGVPDDQCYTINPISSDPIINGPFGNLSTGTKYWAEDNGTNGTIVVTSLPSTTAVQVCSARTAWTSGHIGVDPGWSVVWYDNAKNIFFFGDTVGANADTGDHGGYPACYSAAGAPLSKAYGFGNAGDSNIEGTASPFVYNSTLELNAIAWGLQKAAVSGINPH